MTDILYCHFSFRRPRGENYILCATAFYKDFAGKELVSRYTRAFKMWENQQYVCAVQAFEHALYCIWENQAEMQLYGVKNIYLVTDNSALAKWIEYPKRNKKYAPHMLKAWENYRRNQSKELLLNIGLCEVRKLEKSHKYCKTEFICNQLPDSIKDTTYHEYKLELRGKVRSVQDLIDQDTLTVPSLSKK